MYPSLSVLSAAQMRQCDAYTIHEQHIPSRTLMERAARASVLCLLSRPAVFPVGQVAVLCGGGNNGGDGFAAARFLRDGSCGKQRAVTVIYLGRWTDGGVPDTEHMSRECTLQYAMAAELGLPVLSLAQADEVLADCTAVIDAVFGIGLDRPVSDGMKELFCRINEKFHLPVLALDIPSGVSADTGAVLGAALRANVTVTMQALKPGLLLYPGANLCGELIVADLGIHLSPVASENTIQLVGEDQLRRALPPRRRHTHKGTYGRLALACGSYGMAGAAILSASAALRSGVGLAEVITPTENRGILQTALPEAILTLYDSGCVVSERTQAMNTGCPGASAAGIPTGDRYDGLIIGCGLGTDATAEQVLRTLLSPPPGVTGGTIARPVCPVVLDADALTLLSRAPSLWESPRLCAPERQVVITPHPAEMARLCGQSVPEVLSDLPGTALDFARTHGVVVVLKDAHTVIADPAGHLWISAAGNAGMAKGGSGDVLAGIIGSLLTQNRHRLGKELSVGEVAAAGVLLHAMAADEAARTKGEYSLLASDIVATLATVTAGVQETDSRTHIALCASLR